MWQVGFQVRFIQGNKFEEKNDIVNKNIMNCSLQHGFLPDVYTNLSAPIESKENPNPKLILIYIASLYPGLKDYLTSFYLRHRTLSGDNVRVEQLTHEKAQMTSTEVDREALVEILSLSFSNVLFVTGASTFGALAQVYGAVVPWFINFHDDPAQPACTQAQTLDICFQGGNARYSCPHDFDVDGKKVSDYIPYYTPCLKADTGGNQLVTHNYTEEEFWVG